MKNIFLIGKAGAGKDTVADILSRMYGYEQLTFADNIRFEYNRYFPEQNPRTDRAKLQEIGQTYKKLYGEDVWVRLLEEDMYDEPCSHVVTDGRHKVEYDRFVTELLYVPVFINCPDEIRYERLMKRDGTLQQEALRKECQELWNVEALPLDNSGSFKELEAKLYKLLKSIEGDR